MTPGQRFRRKQAAVPDAAMRRALWLELFEGESAEAVLEIVSELLRSVTRREEPARLAYEALTGFLESVRGREYAPRRALYEAARLAEDAAVCRLLLSVPPARAATEAELRPQVQIGDRELTLGERRSLARKPARTSLLQLLGDPDPGVIANLLRNAYLTEADVLRLASRRPVAGESLRLLFRHPRWGRLGAIHEALVRNPYTPSDVAAALLPLLDLTLLRDMSRDPGLQPALRERARALVAERDAGAAGGETSP